MAASKPGTTAVARSFKADNPRRNNTHLRAGGLLFIQHLRPDGTVKTLEGCGASVHVGEWNVDAGIAHATVDTKGGAGNEGGGRRK